MNQAVAISVGLAAIALIFFGQYRWQILILSGLLVCLTTFSNIQPSNKFGSTKIDYSTYEWGLIILFWFSILYLAIRYIAPKLEKIISKIFYPWIIFLVFTVSWFIVNYSYKHGYSFGYYIYLPCSASVVSYIAAFYHWKFFYKIKDFPKLFAFLITPWIGRYTFPLPDQPQILFKHMQDFDLYRSHIKAAKVFLIVFALEVIRLIMDATFFGKETIILGFIELNPTSYYFLTIKEALSEISRGTVIKPLDAWIIVILDFIYRLVFLSNKINALIGVAMLFGLPLELNTKNVFKSRSLLDFFGKFNFYYKEVLLNYFYYPIFFRLKMLSPGIRVVVSAFLTIGLANYWIHFIWNTFYSRGQSPFGYLIYSINYLIYALLLAFILSFELFISLKGRRVSYPPIIAFPICILVYSSIRVFDDPFLGNVVNNLKLFLMLFNL
ncbi:MAG: hypothetical protein H6625_05770 [Bdellovibrionaceae bacterium]|nr:hypothetical protein [Pseudobdellovibrionaceae bacterium]